MPRVTVRLLDGSVDTFEDWVSSSGQRRVSHRVEVETCGRLVVYRKLEVSAGAGPLVWETESERPVVSYRVNDWSSFGDGPVSA